MPYTRNKGAFRNPTWDQAAKIITKFGGESKLAKLIGMSRCQIYKWNYRSPYGTDGLIPTKAQVRIRAMARLEGVLLTAADWTANRINWEPTEEEQEVVPTTRPTVVLPTPIMPPTDIQPLYGRSAHPNE